MAGLFSGGTGTALDPYLIGNRNDLELINSYMNSHFKQVADIDLSTREWNPIGAFDYSARVDYAKFEEVTGEYAEFRDWINTVESEWDYKHNPSVQFTGSYDGGGYTISDLKINKKWADGVGLFSHTNGGNVKNLKLNNVNIKSKNYAGSIVGIVQGDSIFSDIEINNCVIDSAKKIGGIIGLVGESFHDEYGKETESIAAKFDMINVTIRNADIKHYDKYGGGMIGFIGSEKQGELKKVFFSGFVNGHNRSAPDYYDEEEENWEIWGYTPGYDHLYNGFRGDITGGIVSCSHSENVSISIAEINGAVRGYDAVGMMAGSFCGDADNCIGRGSVDLSIHYFTSDGDSNYKTAAGLIGKIYPWDSRPQKIEKCIFVGGVNSRPYAGGIIGSIILESTTLSGLYTIADYINSDPERYGWPKAGTISMTYHLPWSWDDDDLDDSVGFPAMYDDCFYNEDFTTDLDDYQTSPGFYVQELFFQGNALSRATLKKQATYEAQGFDFENIWKIDEGVSYPSIKWGDSATFTKCERINITKLLGGY